jgi:hypothetical protein
MWKMAVDDLIRIRDHLDRYEDLLFEKGEGNSVEFDSVSAGIKKLDIIICDIIE